MSRWIFVKLTPSAKSLSKSSSVVGIKPGTAFLGDMVIVTNQLFFSLI